MLTRFVHNAEFNDKILRLIGARDLHKLDDARAMLERAAHMVAEQHPRQVTVTIMPGDATAYYLRVEQMGNRLVIVRVDVHGCYPNALGAISLPLDAKSVTNVDVAPLGNGNEWSAHVMAWACAELLRACAQAMRGAVR